MNLLTNTENINKEKEMGKKIEDMTYEEIKIALKENLNFLPNDNVKEQVMAGIFLSMVM